MDPSEFPDSDEEYDLIPTDVYKASRPPKEPPPPSALPNGPSTPAPSDQPDFPDDDFPIEDELNSLQESALASPRGSAPKPPPEKAKKRTFEELRRDVAELLNSCPSTSTLDPADPELFDLGRQDKRPRWNQPKEVIEAIHQETLRNRLVHEGKVPQAVNKAWRSTPRETISLKIPSWNFVALTRPADSQRIYVRLRPKNPSKIVEVTPAGGLLNVNYEKLKEEAEKILVEKVQRESLPQPEGPETSASLGDELWVDKYRPRSYMELLSDEAVNSRFLHWIKLWDKVVFGRELVRKRAPVERPGWKKFVKKEEVELVDKRGFPVHKIALLSGPPGLGKTTLAHLVARHAGYNVVEINASDERGPDAFRQALLSSTQMRSLIGADPRPNCLVLDEIDGAPAPSIELLLKFVQGKLTAKGKKSKELSAKDNEYCKRPIIGICNEAYTPALRSLRQMAYIINVPKVSPANLAGRLATIARREHLKIKEGTLIQLAERSGCDIRACLGALQYLGADCGKSNHSLGNKDMKKSIFEAWREILQVPMDRAGPLTPRERAQRILQVSHSENSERLTQGVFENYPPNCHEKMSKVSISLEWFQLYDRITTVVNTTQDWTVAGYTGYCFVTWHFGFAGTVNPKLTFPHVAGDVWQKTTKTMGILSVARKSRGQDTATIVLDIAPFLFEILNPKLRSVASNLYSTKEKADFERLIDVMLDLGISFVQEKSEEGALDYKIEPDLYEAGIFPDCKARRPLSYAVKQIVAHELEVERLRRAAVAWGASSEPEGSKDGEDEVSKPKEPIPSASAFRPNHLSEMEMVVTPKATKFRNFFEGFTKPSVNNVVETSPKGDKPGKQYRNLIAKYGVWYKYTEGSSNSIRRNVSMEDIL
ncbi:chromosome transmission fidelity protein 18 homolog [Diachasma alloeum]|uniref:chromosome transmission fidelity protein 18 homolog n=1 Tax=Diachasma alloeum TaxID=454923 RepID=UPI0007382418|nr:chromosome transmission fidelity protein 18 homolog [Diachasma alloeum]XP_028982432.1 chromosome transmission fidelity protein 18 homolog [Diachasma alloeum]